MFNELIMHKEKGAWFGKVLLETILGTPIRNLRIIPQKIIQGVDTDKHGIFMDAYIEAYQQEDGTQVTDVELQPDIYDLEPGLYRTKSEEHRTRFYHALLDSRLLDSGTDYHNLKNVTLIMILNYDPFGLDRMVYTIKRRCVEEPDMPYEDGATTIFLYTRGTQNVPSQALKDMLQFLENSTEHNVTNENLQNIHHLMDEIKRDRKVGINYMHTWEREQFIKTTGRIEGQISGIIQTCQKFGASQESAIDNLKEILGLTVEEATQYVKEYWREES